MAYVGDAIVRFLACGSVDDGKSTLIGHLIYLTGNLHADHLLTLQEESSRIGTAGGELDFSLLMDGLMAEREQGITIDVAYRYFSTDRRKFIVADTPGHERYTRNMATGASQCSAAIILVDVRQGVLAQTRRHALICALLGIHNLLFVVNKMDTAGWGESAFRDVEHACTTLVHDLEKFGAPRPAYAVIPISALKGDNLVAASSNTPWYGGPTVMDWLHAVEPAAEAGTHAMRLPVQYVVKVARDGDTWQNGVDPAIKQSGSGTYRAYTGTLASGTIKVGDPVVVLPSGIQTAISGIMVAGNAVKEAAAPMAVAVNLEGEHDVVRGDCICHPENRPEVSSVYKVRLVWMDEHPLYAGRAYLFRSACGQVSAEAARIKSRIDLTSYLRTPADRLELNDIGEAELTLMRSVPGDGYSDNRTTGGFVLIDPMTNATVACGMMVHSLRRATNVHWHREDISRDDRARLKSQRPCVIWLTGLSGSGKSTIANALERRLYSLGRHSMLLDGDNVRHGLCKDLGFTEADRVENIRRVGEVAKLMTDAGLITITAFISPYRTERDMVRALVPAGEFFEVHVTTAIELCEQRDPKGLYRKARQGEIPNFTGINAPYEAPLSPELRIDTASSSPEECAEMIVRRLVEHGFVKEA